MKQDVSDEILGAYVDDELACSEKRAIADEIKSDSELAGRAQSILDLKASIKNAYPENSSGKSRSELPSGSDKRFLKQSIVASLIMACGLILGAILNNPASQSSSEYVSANDTLFGIKVSPVTQQHDKVLLHVSSSDLNKLDYLLTRTEKLLSDSESNDYPLNIEIIANSKGIDLFRKTASPYADRIKKLQQQYSNLQFIACKNTIQRLQNSGQNTQMIKGVKKDKPALDTIINRMDKGWTYVKI